jgi:hypothetical protein
MTLGLDWAIWSEFPRCPPTLVGFALVRRISGLLWHSALLDNCELGSAVCDCETSSFYRNKSLRFCVDQMKIPDLHADTK